MTNRWWNWFKGKKTSRANRNRFRLDIDRLEDRITPVATTLTWTGASSTLWSNAGNWTPAAGADHTTPQNGDTLTFAGNATNTTSQNDVPTTLTLQQINFNLVSGSIADYTITGNSFFLSTQGAEDIDVHGGTQTFNLDANQYINLDGAGGGGTGEFHVDSGAKLRILNPLFDNAPNTGVTNLTINPNADELGTVELGNDNDRVGDAQLTGFRLNSHIDLFHGTLIADDADALGSTLDVTHLFANTTLIFNIQSKASTTVDEGLLFGGNNATVALGAGSDNVTFTGAWNFGTATTAAVRVEDAETTTKGHLFYNGPTNGLNVSGADTTITKTGAGTWNVLNSNPAVGTNDVFLVSQGVLEMDSATALGSANANVLQVGSGGTLRLGAGVATGANPRLQLAGTLQGPVSPTGTATFGGAIQLSGSSKLDAPAGTLLQLAGVIIGGVSDNVTKTGAGEVDLFGANTYQGSTTVDAGQLTLHNINALGASFLPSNDFTRVNAGATLAIGGTPALPGNPQLLETIFLNGGTLAALSSFRQQGPLTLEQTSSINAAAGQTLTIENTVTGAGGLDVNSGTTGTVSFSGAPGNALANDYQGTTRVLGGTLVLGKNANVIAIPHDLEIDATNAAATVRNDASEQIADSATVTVKSVGANAATWNMNGNDETITKLVMTGGTVSGTNSDLIIKGDTVTINGFTAPSVISISTLHLTQNTTFDVSRGTGLDDLDISSAIVQDNGTWGITKTGAGIMQMTGTGNNTYTGTTQVNEGALWLFRDPDNNTIKGPLVVGDGIGPAGSAIVRLRASAQIDNNASWTINSDGRMTLDPNVIEEVLAGTIENGIIDVGTSGDLRIGAGNLTFNGGEINLGSFGQVSLQNQLTKVIVGDNLVSFINDVSGGVGGPGAVNLNAQGRTFTVGQGAFLIVTGDLRNGALNGSGIIKDGPGTMTLSGPVTAGTYTGPTVINDGILNNNWNHPQSPVTVNASGSQTGVLGGTGTAGPTTVNGGQINPGVPGTPGTLTIAGNIIFNSDVHVDVSQFVPTNGAVNADKLVATGYIKFNSTTNIIPNQEGNVPAGTQFVIMNSTAGGILGANFLPDTIPGYQVLKFPAQIVLKKTLLQVSSHALSSLSGSFTSTYGDVITLTETIVTNPNDPTPTGNVNFNINGTNYSAPILPTSDANTYAATLSLPVGTLNADGPYPVVVTYSDSNYALITDTASLTVLKKDLSAASTLVIANTSLNFGQSTTATFTLGGIPGNTNPTGNVIFTDTSTGSTIAVVPIAGGSAVATLSNLSATPSLHNIEAKYVGDVNFTPVTKTASVTVTTTATTTNLVATPTPVANGVSLGMAATVNRANAGGTVIFFDDLDNDGVQDPGEKTLGTAVAGTSNGATTTFSAVSTVLTGSAIHHVAASYSGDGLNLNPSHTGGTGNPANASVNIATAGFTDITSSFGIAKGAVGTNGAGHRTQKFTITNKSSTTFDLSKLFLNFKGLTQTYPGLKPAKINVEGHFTTFNGFVNRQIKAAGTLAQGQSVTVTVTYQSSAGNTPGSSLSYIDNASLKPHIVLLNP